MKILYITTIGATMGFFESFIKELIADGHTVDIATNAELSPVPEIYNRLGCKVYPLSCSRSPFSSGNIKAVKEIKGIVAENGYDIVHCHTPIAAACTRLACRKARKNGLKVFYTAHGLHFFKGAPLKNWVIFYPVEKLCAPMTDLLITINNEDFTLARKKLKAKRVVYVPGVGVDTSKYTSVTIDRAEKRSQLAVPDDAFLLISVGEVNENKNHRAIIKAIAESGVLNAHYIIAGEGNQEENLKALAQNMGVGDRVHLLGYRRDINELCAASDVFCFPSFREGQGLAAIEGMLCGLPLITSNVHGINDYSIDDVSGFKCAPTDISSFAKAIKKLAESPSLREKMAEHNKAFAMRYDVSIINKQMKEIYFGEN